MEEEEEKPTKKRKVGKKQKVKVGEAPVGDVVKGGGSQPVKPNAALRKKESIPNIDEHDEELRNIDALDQVLGGDHHEGGAAQAVIPGQGPPFFSNFPHNNIYFYFIRNSLVLTFRRWRSNSRCTSFPLPAFFSLKIR